MFSLVSCHDIYLTILVRTDIWSTVAVFLLLLIVCVGDVCTCTVVCLTLHV